MSRCAAFVAPAPLPPRAALPRAAPHAAPLAARGPLVDAEGYGEEEEEGTEEEVEDAAHRLVQIAFSLHQAVRALL